MASPDPYLGAYQQPYDYEANYGAYGEEGELRLAAVPVKLAMEAVRRKKREEAARKRQPRKGVAIPFHQIRSPAEAHTYARLILAKERSMGFDVSDQPTSDHAADAALAILRRAQNRVDIHLTAGGPQRQLNIKADMSVSATDYWNSLNQEFRELCGEAYAGAPEGATTHRPELIADGYVPPQSPLHIPAQQMRNYTAPPAHAECGYCHLRVPIAARFCHSCGAPQLGVQPPTYPVRETMPEALPTTTRSMPFSTPAAPYTTPAGPLPDTPAGYQSMVSKPSGVTVNECDPEKAEEGSPAAKKNTAISVGDAPASGFFTDPGAQPSEATSPPPSDQPAADEL